MAPGYLLDARCAWTGAAESTIAVDLNGASSGMTDSLGYYTGGDHLVAVM